MDCGLDYELRIDKSEFKLKKVRKTIRPFRYDLNQIPYDFTVEMTNRFKGLDLIDRVPEDVWMEVCDTVQEAVIKTIPVRKHLTGGFLCAVLDLSGILCSLLIPEYSGIKRRGKPLPGLRDPGISFVNFSIW